MATSKIHGNMDTGWITLNTEVKYRKVNGIVYVVFNSTTNALSPGGTSLGNLPTGYRPSLEQIDVGGGSKGGSQVVFFRVQQSGYITGYASSNTSYWSGLISYPAD